jgi:hypothetical protein
MDKSAQSKRQTGRGFFNELREKVNMPGAYLEGFFKPELDRVMTSLKSLDDQVRSELTGKTIGQAAPSIATSAKDLLKAARTNFNRREYISGVSDLGMFHKKMQDIVNLINKFFVDVNKIHHKFLFEGVEDEKVKRLREHMEKKLAQELRMQLIKQAGIMDFFHNIGTKRGRGLAAWEKKYPKETKALREGGTKLLDSADALLATTIAHMKEMATARATRRPDDYMDAANKIKAEFEKFDGGEKGFRAYYNTAIMPFMLIKDDIDSGKYKPLVPETPSGATPPVELGNQPPPPDQAKTAPTQPLPPVPDLNVPQGKPPVAPVEGPVHDTEKNLNKKLNHERFYESLESMSEEDPRILAGYITKYATSIQESDLETAIKLFAIVKRLKG